MKHEIKFRGLRAYGKGLAYGYYYEYSGKHIICYQDHSDNSTTDHWEEVIPETLGQFTGLKDKNGVEIYEGDIIDINQTVNGCSKFVILTCIGGYDVRYYYENNLQREYEYSIYELLDIGRNEKEIEVIGSIHTTHDKGKEESC